MILAAGFHIWMFFDALQRRAAPYWYLIILFLPFGSVLYFFFIKLPDYVREGGPEAVASPSILDLELAPSKPSLTDLRLTAEETPSVINKIALAQALHENEHYEESAQLFFECLEIDDEDSEALYGLASCRTRQGRFEEATRLFKKLISNDTAFHDYAGWLDLAFVYWQLKSHDQAIETLIQLVTESPRVKHKTILGRYLAQVEKYEQARTVLRQAIADYEESSLFLKRDNHDWVFEARQILDGLPI